jgi:hypothetical protein
MEDNNNTKIESRLNESQIEYKIYLFIRENEDVQILYQEIIEYIEQLSQHYIWNNEKFQLKKPIESNNSNCYLSSGCIDFGDNLEDEWFIVFILFKLTSKFSKQLVAQTRDQDGDFLLIHAANYLPDWASSAADDCMNNRVFIYNGKLHMIPPATNPSQITYLPAAGPISNSYAGAKTVFDFSNLTQAIDDVQKSIQKRISLFESEKINLIYHKASCTIPAKLTWLLKNNPSLISAAINRFCDKDPKDLKLCRTFETFKPVDLVNYRVTFTKHLYGKLKYCEYKPEKRHQWPSINKLMDSNDVAISSNTNNSSTSVIRERSNLGFKLTCAFEILFKRLLNDNSTNKSFDNYVKRLKNLGYFKDFIENSKSYTDLMEKARQSYSNTHHLTTPALNKNEPTTKSMSSSDEKPPSIQSDSLTSITTSDYEPVEAPPKSFSTDLLDSYSNLLDSFYLDKLISEDYVVKLKEEICMNQEKDDSDDWLCVEAPQLDDYLDMYSRGEVSSTYDFRIISNAFKKFLQSPKAKTDLLEGTDFKSIEKNDEKLIDINADSIQSSLKNILLNNLKINQDKEQDDDDDDDEDENDSFYEIKDDLLDNDEDVTGEKELSDNLKNYMDLMDLELKEQKNLSRVVDSSSSTITGSSKNNDNQNNSVNNNANKDDLDIDLNLVTNALESYSSQLGLSGPVSNILKSIGL